MTLKKADVLFVVAVCAVVAGVFLLPTPRQQNPKVPADADHRAAVAGMECQRCHVAGGSSPLRIPPHPKRTDCLRCHARQE